MLLNVFYIRQLNFYDWSEFLTFFDKNWRNDHSKNSNSISSCNRNWIHSIKENYIKRRYLNLSHFSQNICILNHSAYCYFNISSAVQNQFSMQSIPPIYIPNCELSLTALSPICKKKNCNLVQCVSMRIFLYERNPNLWICQNILIRVSLMKEIYFARNTFPVIVNIIIIII